MTEQEEQKQAETAAQVASRPRGMPEYGADGRLTFAGMRKVIQQGGSVLHGGQIISRIEDLPPAAQVVGDDPKARAELKKDLEKQKTELDKQLETLTKAPPAENKGEEPDKDEDETEPEEKLDYSGLSKDQLIRAILDRGMPCDQKLNKAQLVEILEEDDKTRSSEA